MIALALMISAHAAAPEAAQPAATSEQAATDFEPHALRNTGGWFLAGEFVVSIGVGFFMPDMVMEPAPDDLTCADAWCDTNGFDVALNKAFLMDNAHAAGTVSHVLTIGLTPVVGFAGVIAPAIAAGKGSYGLQDSVIMLDAFVITTGFNSLAKMGANRQRPAFHYGRQANTEAGDLPDEEFVSFYSGDTTWAFTLASSASTLAYLRGYPSAPYIAVGTGALALTGGILRMSADMHWATDVLVGAAAGTMVGVGLPLLLHGRKSPKALALVPSVGAESSGLALTGTW